MAVKKYVFQQNNKDHTFLLKQRQGRITTMIVYVDGIIITRDDSKEIANH